MTWGRRVEMDAFDGVQRRVQRAEGTSLIREVIRDGEEISLAVTPSLNGEAWVIGAMIGYTYNFPFELELQLGDVGGPSGGLIFSLGVLDALTEGSLAGKVHVAGTGTIDPEGNVGPIGGIALKMLGAKRAGAELFLAPAANCQEAIGQIPSNLTVVLVRDLTEALDKIEMFANGEQLPAMQCNN